MCDFCGTARVDPAVAKLWEEEGKTMTPELRSYVDRAAEMLKEEIKKHNESTSQR